jgi:DNA primase
MFDKTKLPDPVSYFENSGHKIIGKAGKRFRTACAIHGGTGNNLSVLRDSGGFYCFACQATGGDVLAYEMQVTGADFVTAAKALGAWIDDDGTKREPHQPKPVSRNDAMKILEFEELLLRIINCDINRLIQQVKQTLSRRELAHNRIQKIREIYKP